MSNGAEVNKSRRLQFLEWIKNPTTLFAALGIVIFVVLAYGIYSAGGVFLKSLQAPEAARGLITFLVAFTTVAIALILVLYALLSGGGSQDLKDRFGFGKEILTSLIGVLGTILGFYFGSSTQPTAEEAINSELSKAQGLQVASAFISNEQPKKGEQMMLSSFVSGGKPPYIYSISFIPPNILNPVVNRTSPDGVIKEEINIPDTIQKDTEVTFQIVIKDSTGKLATYDDKTKKFLIKPQ